MSYDRVVVGLTTTPSRVEKLGPALAALAAQTRMPDAVYVSVPEFSTCENKEYDRQAIDAALARALGGEDAMNEKSMLLAVTEPMPNMLPPMHDTGMLFMMRLSTQ